MGSQWNGCAKIVRADARLHGGNPHDWGGSVASTQTLERRILAVETRLAEVEGAYGETLYKLHRASVKSDLRTARILEALKIRDVSEDEIDNAMDEA